MHVERLDHVALRVGDRVRLTDFLTAQLGMHVIEDSERLTLVGGDPWRGKLALLPADGGRDPGQLGRIAVGVPDLTAVLDRLPPDLAVERSAPGEARFLAPDRVPLALVERPGLDGDWDIDRVVLRARHPMVALNGLRHLGFETANGHLEAGPSVIEIAGGDPGDPAASMLDHLGLLVDSAENHLEEARRRTLEIDGLVDTQDARSVFVLGPERIRLEYVERKVSYSLA